MTLGEEEASEGAGLGHLLDVLDDVWLVGLEDVVNRAALRTRAGCTQDVVEVAAGGPAEGHHAIPQWLRQISNTDPREVVGVVGDGDAADLAEQVLFATGQHEDGVGGADHAAGAVTVSGLGHIAQGDDDPGEGGILQVVRRLQVQAGPSPVGSRDPEVLGSHGCGRRDAPGQHRVRPLQILRPDEVEDADPDQRLGRHPEK